MSKKLTEDPLEEKKDYHNRRISGDAQTSDKNKELIESLHVMFTLYHVFENNQNIVQNKQ